MKKTQSGFTLLEMIVVIAILGVLASFATPRYVDVVDKSKTSIIESAGSAVRSANTFARGVALTESLHNLPESSITIEGKEVKLTHGNLITSSDNLINAIDTGITMTDYVPRGDLNGQKGVLFHFGGKDDNVDSIRAKGCYLDVRNNNLGLIEYISESCKGDNT
ncbi:conserved hypothetical protein [Vibrio nigripulchritudo SO65]|uniref:type IV pilin protein n=1 Tax=Vibrio nigripulchritudo TaxID=28173 RepID=UPI0003B1F06B|nr:type II secretion system protein [Vibrio nigripulchritudo]CCN35023.1 conserved hypothetical protein [Vibrio nigripulchritudo AM115]CCN39696.1 conserved hypothetical protein [Vibrio nigripulchritudo FTn2]CCN63322.1 conserved hypothetical protein [Vibrio nigripulchritudo POn4]CCN77942.1 conserved hypothetical protein [Vibrio nigripulchritudo SO65]